MDNDEWSSDAWTDAAELKASAENATATRKKRAVAKTRAAVEKKVEAAGTLPTSKKNKPFNPFAPGDKKKTKKRISRK